VLLAKVGSGGPLVRLTGHLGWLGGQVSCLHRLSHFGSSSYRLNMTHVKSVISLVPTLAGRHHLGSVGPELFAMSSPRVILSETTLGFGHNEDMCGFWSI
jgi:hypothetical protein